MAAVVTDQMVAAYLPRVERLARRFRNRPGVDEDDLIQEGLIDVWLTLRRGQSPSDTFIASRMLRWCEFVTRQYPADYDDMLPLGDFENDYHRLVE